MIFCIGDNIISPLGETTAQNYQAVKAGSSQLRRYEHHKNIPEPFAASLFTDLQSRALAVEGLTRFESLACTSAQKAIQASGIDVRGENVLFVLSTTKGNIEKISEPLSDERLLYPCTAAEHIAHKLGFSTRPVTVCNACISGVSAMLLAYRLLEVGVYDYAVVCGADTQSQFTISGFQSLKAVSETDCRPFDIERLGLNLGEAAATVVLSRHDKGRGWAIERGAVRNDGFHISSPSKNGEGARLSLASVMKDCTPDRLAFINAHGTATMFNDQMESIAIERAGLQSVPVNALKGCYGHTLGAAGILETVISMAAVDDHTIPSTRGFQEIGVSGKIKVASQNTATEKHSFVKMISGFGGCNGAILLSKDVQPAATPVVSPGFTKKHTVRITPTELTVDGRQLACEDTGKAMLTNIYKRYINNYSKFYKMDGLSRLGLVASDLLIQSDDSPVETSSDGRAVVLFNHSSSIQADKLYQASIQNADDYFPSPAAFVYTLPNIVTGEIAIRNHYHGETSFYILLEKDEVLMSQIMSASFQDETTQSILGGWLDYEDDDHFEADLYIVEKTK